MISGIVITKMAGPEKSAGFAGIVAATYQRKWSFLVAFLLVFFTAFSVLTALDMVPEPRMAEEDDEQNLTATVLSSIPEEPELPLKIEIPEIDLEVAIENPTDTDVAVLDRALLKGAVRYPTSAELGEEGNVILFGHSSYLPVVNNDAFKIFNKIQDLEEGDRIIVYGTDSKYVYEVETVSQEDANSAAIPLEVGEPTLTLATCDSFGKKTDRFVVIAKLVERQALES